MRIIKWFVAIAVTATVTLGRFVTASADATRDELKPTHWSFVPPARPAEPEVRDRTWVRNSIDQFILHRLERDGITPSPQADRATLIRRLSLDLRGLPPSVEELNEFLSDQAADAYERLVDRLIASPHYGERWGRHWLDMARYADSNGYTIDGARSIWKYRDWVIRALNEDMPFDEFTIMQLAGDMLPADSATTEERKLDRLIATGFHRNTLKNEEGGTDPEQFRIDAVADRLSTTSSVFLGLTVACARCHDHKYDPISQREYFQMFALLNNADEPTLPVPTNQQAKEEPALVAEIAEAEKRLKMVDDNSGGRQAEWEMQFAERLGVQWHVLSPTEVRSAGGASLEVLPDNAVLASGTIPERDTYTIVAQLPAELVASGVTAVRLEAIPHDSLPQRGPGLAANGNFVLHEFRAAVQLADAANSELQNGEASADSSTAKTVAFASATADHSQDKYPIAASIDGKSNTGWAINVPGKLAEMNVLRAAEFVLAEPITASGRIVFTIEQTQAHYALGCFRLSLTSAPADVVKLPARVREALQKAPDQRDAQDQRLIRAEFYKVDKERIPIAGRVDELKQLHQQLKSSVTTTLVMRERTMPRETHVHVRGDFLRPGDRVTPAVPAVLPPIQSTGAEANRLDFARWLVDSNNPLTARVTVNRIWQTYFGRGLVETENDFGTQGSLPSHPELLDWLANEFMMPTANTGRPATPWSLKHIHRLIVTSAVYRQSSAFRPELVRTDPNNILLARQTRLRLEAETIRDVALASSGLLSREIGGPGVYPPQPQGVYRFTQVVKFWKEAEGADRFRRGLYTYFWRSSPYPFLSTFDAPDGNVTCTRRVRSNTPLQALTLANDRAFFEMAQGLVVRVLRESSSSDMERVRHAVRLCLARDATEWEEQRLLEFLAVERNRFAQAPDQAELAAPKNRPESATVTDAAAWTAVARVLMNLDEFITRE